MIVELEPVVALREPAEAVGPEHPMRAVTRQVAFDTGGWTPERAAKVASLFDGLAGEWHRRDTPGRLEPLTDALDRGGVSGRICLELGSGTGLATALLASRFRRVVAVDLAREMLARAPSGAGLRVLADASRLPLRSSGVDVAVLMNMLLFPAELDRVLAPGGALVWVNSRAEGTPIHLPVADVAAALPGEWEGVTSRAGEGLWGVLRRRR